MSPEYVALAAAVKTTPGATDLFREAREWMALGQPVKALLAVAGVADLLVAQYPHFQAGVELRDVLPDPRGERARECEAGRPQLTLAEPRQIWVASTQKRQPGRRSLNGEPSPSAAWAQPNSGSSVTARPWS